MIDQVRENLENLALDPDPHTGAPQLNPGKIELEIVEEDNHDSTLALWAARDGRGGDAISHGLPHPSGREIGWRAARNMSDLPAEPALVLW